jgi:hypothetical protein
MMDLWLKQELKLELEEYLDIRVIVRATATSTASVTTLIALSFLIAKNSVLYSMVIFTGTNMCF